MTRATDVHPALPIPTSGPLATPPKMKLDFFLAFLLLGRYDKSNQSPPSPCTSSSLEWHQRTESCFYTCMLLQQDVWPVVDPHAPFLSSAPGKASHHMRQKQSSPVFSLFEVLSLEMDFPCFESPCLLLGFDISASWTRIILKPRLPLWPTSLETRFKGN